MDLWIIGLAQECLSQAPSIRLAYEHECLDHLQHGAREYSAVAARQDSVAFRIAGGCEREKAASEAQEPGIGLLLDQIKRVRAN